MRKSEGFSKISLLFEKAYVLSHVIICMGPFKNRYRSLLKQSFLIKDYPKLDYDYYSHKHKIMYSYTCFLMCTHRPLAFIFFQTFFYLFQHLCDTSVEGLLIKHLQYSRSATYNR